MIEFKSIKTDEICGREYRFNYYNDVLRTVARKAETAREIRDRDFSPAAIAENREEYRKKFVDMLGWPLNEYVPDFSPRFKKELIEETGDLKIYRLCIETLPELWFEGLIYVPNMRDEKAPLAIINPGGSYCAEELVAHGDYECEQYRNIGGRALEKGMILYAPQFLLWLDDTNRFNHPIARQHIDAKLKALGGSIAALEIFNVKRAIDYFIGNEPIDENRIGMMGLSYGGFYALYISAAETRIKSTFSSCFLCDRFCSESEPTGCRFDWLWQNSANSFFDAEVAALIAPRALYVENGVRDQLFPIDIVKAEQERLKPFYSAANADENLLLYIGENGHRVSDGDLGFNFFMKNLI